ncbi:hypothetical protein BCE75_10646 [Isoptericola sp. CG 20/1183]|uniref:Transcriptional regulator, AbiEi antitoxin, Type IV TA system n=1 Tax=Isoptericola halotolerans TaxID=300560 RepID=A0ABX5EDM8_9MICO|nr:hypothetical protein BCL65_106188 [Isoptericola halotolerans]PRZ06681.1 hypothetical protein BCE75_10646 [Isoptericola sp. CG 20/1183]
MYTAVPGLMDLLRRQHMVLSRAQLSRLGVRHDHVACHLRALRWRALSGTVVVAHRGPLTRPARRWAAVLGAPTTSVLGAWTALELHRLQGWHREPVHLVVDRGSAPDRYRWLVVHESRRLCDEHVTTREGLPVHTVARAAVDAAAWQRSWRTAVGLMAAVVQQRLASTDDQFGMLDAVGQVRIRLPAMAARHEPGRVVAIARRHLGW